MKTLLLIITILSFWPCRAQDEKYFSLYHKQIRDASSAPFRTDGIYIKRGDGTWDWSYAVTFYANGIFCLNGGQHNASLGTDFDDSLRFVQRMAFLPPNRMTDPEVWGFYIIRGDTLISQRPYLLRYGGLPPYVSIDQTWLIGRHSVSNISFKVHKTLFKKRAEKQIPDTGAFEFYPSSYKPDSSYAWFFYKDWYQNSVSER